MKLEFYKIHCGVRSMSDRCTASDRYSTFIRCIYNAVIKQLVLPIKYLKKCRKTFAIALDKNRDRLLLNEWAAFGVIYTILFNFLPSKIIFHWNSYFIYSAQTERIFQENMCIDPTTYTVVFFSYLFPIQCIIKCLFSK